MAMKRTSEPLPLASQEFLLSRIGRVRNELDRLGNLISNDEQLNNVYIKRFLEDNHVSEDSSDLQSDNLTHHFLGSGEQLHSSRDHPHPESSTENITFSHTLSRLSDIKAGEPDATGLVGGDAWGLRSTMNQLSLKEAKENNRTEEKEHKLSITKKKGRMLDDAKETFKHQFVELKSKHKLTYTKSLKCLNSGNRSKPNALHKKSTKEMREMPVSVLSKRGSTKASSTFNYLEPKHLFDEAKRLPGKVPASPKLNKINGNKFRENIKKTMDIKDNNEMVVSKLYLNLSEHKSLMQRALEKGSFHDLYVEETRKYEACIAQLSESLIMRELDTDFGSKSDFLKLLMVFLSQFSETIRDFLRNKAHKVQLKFKHLIKETLAMLTKLPVRLYRNNSVNYARYSSLISNRIGIHKAGSRLEEAVKTLKEYLGFLYKSGLIDMTDRDNEQSARNMVQYYSHRSYKEKIKIKGKLSVDFKAKPERKLYETQRKSTPNDDDYNAVTIKPPKLTHKFPEASVKHSKMSGKISPKHKVMTPCDKNIKSPPSTKPPLCRPSSAKPPFSYPAVEHLRRRL